MTETDDIRYAHWNGYMKALKDIKSFADSKTCEYIDSIVMPRVEANIREVSQ